MKKKSKNRIKTIEHIKCVWGLICSLSSIDQERNNISLFNVIDQFNIPNEFFIEQEKGGVPLIFAYPYEIVLCWRRLLALGISNEEITADFKIKTIDPAGKVLQEILSPLTFIEGIKILRSRILVQGLMASAEGEYVHQIELKLSNQDDFAKVLEIPFLIRKLA